MKSVLIRLSLCALLLVSIAVAGARPSRSDSRTRRQAPSQAGPNRIRTERPLSYRSSGSRHKLMLSNSDRQLLGMISASDASTRVKQYQDYTLLEVSDAQLASLNADQLERIAVRDDLNLIRLKRGQIDTTAPEPNLDKALRQPAGLASSLHLVQLFGAPTNDAVRAIRSTGAQVLSYIPNDAYLVWVTQPELSRIKALEGLESVIQWQGPYHPAYKIDPRIDLSSVEQIPLSVTLVDSPASAKAIEYLKSTARRVLVNEFQSAGMLHIRLVADSFRAAEFARLAPVIAIEPWPKIRLMDERANQIAAGSLSFDTVSNALVAHPTSPGYLSFLSTVGIDSDFDFAVDVGDTGFDVGSADAARVHPDFLNSAGASRIAYLHDLTGDPHLDQTIQPAHDPSGHGTLNASILGGFNNGTGSAFVDPLGFDYGIGMAPFAKIGISKLFTDDGFFANLSFNDVIGGAYQNGARISSNSWGACDPDILGFCNIYSDDATVVDALVRDGDPGTFGNQGMVLVFAAGNDGESFAPTISSPGTAKNVITVGASENFRPEASDGCGVRAAEADNALDVVQFSSSGPVQDGRAKPDLVAPGTHIQGAATQDPTFANAPESDLGVCNRFFPPGQTLYTWSSGTSHSTPIVSGGAALAFQWLKSTIGAEPSPALVKAFLLNSTSYISGKLGNDDLPGAHQGWGLLDIGRMLESTNRIIYDQSPDRTFTESGGAPFEITGVVNDASKEFRAMLVWTDAPGNAATNAPYVNQLNLEVTVGGVKYLGNVFDHQYSKTGGQADFLNNAQGVRLPAGITGPFKIRVIPTVIAGDGVPFNGTPLDQDFALVVTNGAEEPAPVLTVDTSNELAEGVTIQHADGQTDANLLPGETAKVTVTVHNESPTSPAEIQGASLKIIVNNVETRVLGGSFPTIPPGGSAQNVDPFTLPISSSLRCGDAASLEIDLDTTLGEVKLAVPVQVGRPGAGSPAQLLFDDVDSHTVKVKLKKGFTTVSGQAHSGTQSYHVEDPGKEDGDTRKAILYYKKGFSIPSNAGHVRLTFFHIFNFEPGYDGGILEISSDGGVTFEDAGSRILSGGYDGKLTETSNNPLGTRFAWTSRGVAGVFSQVVVNLDDYVGKKIKLRFTAGFDEAAGIANGYTGWFIDDVRVTAGLFSCP
jgi:hypothetical protein